MILEWGKEEAGKHVPLMFLKPVQAIAVPVYFFDGQNRPQKVLLFPKANR